MEDDENKDSISTGAVGPVDDGSESFTVGAASEEVEEKGSDAPAEKPVDEDGDTKDGDGADQPETDKGKKPADFDDEDIPDDKLPKGVLKRLDKMRRKQGDSEREAERLRMENETLRKAQQQQKDIGDKPKPSDYETDADYIDAVTDWKVNKAMAEREQKEADRRAEENKKRSDYEAEERHREIQKKLKDGEKKYQDFKDVVFKDNVPITPQIVEISGHFDNVADVFYYLGKNIEEAVDIARSGPAVQALALKEISDKLKIKEKKTTKAPAPIKPISSTGAGLKDLENMSYPEYCKARAKAEKEAKGG